MGSSYRSTSTEANVTCKLNETVSSEDVPILTMDDLSPESYAVREDSFHANRKQPTVRHGSNAVRKDLHKELSRSRPDFEHTSFYSDSNRRDDHHHSANNSLEQSSTDLLAENQSLRKKLLLLREENAHIVSQNHKLLNELEGTSCDLHQSRRANKELNEQRIEKDALTAELEEEIRRLKVECDRLEKSLRSEEDRSESYQLVLSSAEAKLKERDVAWQRVQKQIDLLADAKRVADETNVQLQQDLTNTSALLQASIEKQGAAELELRRKLEESERSCHELVSVAATLKSQLVQLQDESKSASHSNLQQTEKKVVELTAKLREQEQTIERLENAARRVDEVEGEKRTLELTCQRQSEQLVLYSDELQRTRSRLEQLEKMALQLDNKMQSLGDSGLSSFRTVDHDNDDTSLDGSYLGTLKRKTVADSRGRSGHQGQAAAMLGSPVHQQRASVSQLSFADCVHHIRTDLLSFYDRSQLGERRRTEAEQLIGRLEETHVVAMERAAAFETELSNTLDRLHEGSDNMAALVRELDTKSAALTKAERELKKRQAQITALEQQLDEKVGEVAGLVSRITDSSTETEQLATEYQKMRAAYEEKKRECIDLTASLDLRSKQLCEKDAENERLVKQLEKKFQENVNELKKKESIIVKLEQDINAKDMALADLQEEVTSRDGERQKIVRQLEQQVGSEAELVRELEHSLAVCKEEVKLYAEHLHTAKNNFDLELTRKQQQVDQLQSALQSAQQLAADRDTHVRDLELSSNEHMALVSQANSRIAELEDAQALIEVQMAELEQELLQEKTRRSEDVTKLAADNKTLEARLHQATAELDSNRRLCDEVGTALKEIKVDRKKLAEELTEMQRQMKAEKQEVEDKASRLSKQDSELRQQRQAVQERDEMISELEEQMRHLRDDVKEKTQAAADLTILYQRTQSEMNSVTSKLAIIEDGQEKLRRELAQKEQTIGELRQTIRQRQDELASKSRELEQMDLMCHERDLEVQQRALQISQLDVTIADYKSDMEERLARLETALRKSQADLLQRTKQVADLDERVRHLQTELRDKSQQLVTLQQDGARHKMAVEHKSSVAEQLQQELESSQQQISELQQQLTRCEQDLVTAREKYKKTEASAAESGGELALLRHDCERLKREVADCHVLIKEKTEESARVVQELRRLVRVESELAAAKVEIVRLNDVYQWEVAEMRQQVEQVVKGKEELAVQYTQRVRELLDAEQRLLGELRQVRAQFSELETEVQAQRSSHSLHNDAIVIKDAEIARLQAKLSGFQRLLVLAPTSANVSEREVSLVAKGDGKISAAQQFVSSEPQMALTLSKSLPLSLHADSGRGTLDDASDASKYSPQVALAQLSSILSRSLVGEEGHPASSSFVSAAAGQSLVFPAAGEAVASTSSGKVIQFGDISSISSTSTYNAEEDPDSLQTMYRNVRTMYEDESEAVASIDNRSVPSRPSAKTKVSAKATTSRAIQFSDASGSKASASVQKGGTVRKSSAPISSSHAKPPLANAASVSATRNAGRGNTTTAKGSIRSPRRSGSKDRVAGGDGGARGTNNSNNNVGVSLHSAKPVRHFIDDDDMDNNNLDVADDYSAMSHYSVSDKLDINRNLLGQQHHVAGEGHVKVQGHGYTAPDTAVTAAFRQQLDAQRRSLATRQQQMLGRLKSTADIVALPHLTCDSDTDDSA